MSTDERRARLYYPVFYIATAIYSVASCTVHPVTPTLFIDMGFASYMFGVALACNVGMIFFFSPFWGKMTDYLAPRTILVIACLGYAFAQVLFGIARDEAGIIAARLICGVFTGAGFVGQLSYVTMDASEPARRAGRLTVLATINAVGSPFGYLVGGLAGEITPRAAIWTQIGMLLVSALLFFLFTRRDVPHKRFADTSAGPLLRECNPFISFTYAKEFLKPFFLMLLLSACLQNLAQTGFDQSFNYYTRDQFGMSSGYTGLIKGGIGVVSLLANLFIAARILKKGTQRTALIPVFGAAVVTILGMLLSGSISVFFVFTFSVYACAAVAQPLIQNSVAAESTVENAGIVMGFYNSLKFLGGFLGALASGFLYGASPYGPFWMAAVSYLLGMICVVFYRAGVRKAGRGARQKAR